MSILVPGPSTVSQHEVWTKKPGIWGSHTNKPQEDDLFLGPTVAGLHTEDTVVPSEASAIPAGSMGQKSAAGEQLVHTITGDYPVLPYTQQAWGNSPVVSSAATPWQMASHLRMAHPGLGGCT